VNGSDMFTLFISAIAASANIVIGLSK
jgi:hypothetical protein